MLNQTHGSSLSGRFISEAGVDWVGLVNAFGDHDWSFIGAMALLGLVAIAISRSR